MFGGNLSGDVPAVASLGWVTPGAATEGVTFLFSSEKNSHHRLCQFCGVTPAYFYFLPEKLATFFAHHCHFLLISLESHCMPRSVTPHIFYLSDLVSPLFYVNLSTNFFSFGYPGRSGPRPS